MKWKIMNLNKIVRRDESYIWVILIAVKVFVALPQKTKMALQYHLGIYVWYNSQSIISFIKLLIGDIWLQD